MSEELLRVNFLMVMPARYDKHSYWFIRGALNGSAERTVVLFKAINMPYWLFFVSILISFCRWAP